MLGVSMAILIRLANRMLDNHFAKLERSLTIYNDPKIYKTELDTAFLDTVITKYKQLDPEALHKADIDLLIETTFYEQSIGKFKYKLIHNLSSKGQIILWMILFFQIMLEVNAVVDAPRVANRFYIIGLGIIALILAISNLFADSHAEQTQLLTKIKNYVVNTYPLEIKEKHYQDNINKLTSRIDKLEAELARYNDPIVPEADVPITIKEEDIKVLLKNFDKAL